jgi:hypothetical protein
MTSRAITEKTPLPLKLVATLLGLSAGLASAAAVGQYQIHDTSARVEVLETRTHAHDLSIQRNEDAWQDVRESLKEIKEDLKELRRNREHP